MIMMCFYVPRMSSGGAAASLGGSVQIHNKIYSSHFLDGPSVDS